MKYRLIPNDTIKNLIEFLDEIQFEAAKINSTDAHHQVNFCNWAINELLNSYNVKTTEHFGKSKDDKRKPNKKSRDQYVDETFMDWNLPDMTDDEYEKLVDQFDAFLRAWEKEYNKKNPKKKSTNKRKEKEWKPKFEDVVQHCSLEEIKDMLLDDPELSDYERFELYYEEHERVQREKEASYTVDQICKEVGINRYKQPPKNKKK